VSLEVIRQQIAKITDMSGSRLEFRNKPEFIHNFSGFSDGFTNLLLISQDLSGPLYASVVKPGPGLAQRKLVVFPIFHSAPSVKSR
jgi:hypothetical protein